MAGVRIDVHLANKKECSTTVETLDFTLESAVFYICSSSGTSDLRRGKKMRQDYDIEPDGTAGNGGDEPLGC